MTVSVWFLVFIASFIVGFLISISGIFIGWKIAKISPASAANKKPKLRLCEGCGHGVSVHMDGAARFVGCRSGGQGINGVFAGACECEVYIGKRPPSKLIHQSLAGIGQLEAELARLQEEAEAEAKSTETAQPPSA